MRTIQIDDEVYQHLQRQAIPFEEALPNDTLRRLFGLNSKALPAEAQKPLEDPVPTKPRLNTAHPPRKKLKTSLRLLIEAGLLHEGQTLYLHDYDGSRIPGDDFQSEVCANRILWKINDQSYSLSALAIELLHKRGHRSAVVRGPARWFTEDETSIQTLWDRYLKGR